MAGQLHLARAVWGPVPLAPAVMAQSFGLPAGTTTFVSADVDSSALRREGGGEVGQAMGAIDAVFSAAVGRHGGVRPMGQGEGGSFLAAFARASEALACALDVQRQLQADNLSCLRAGLHTGEAEVRDEVRYFGQAVARTGRLRDLGHGGQVLVSRASADLVADRLPAGASMTDLGPHRMHDLSRPVQVYQLCHPDLAADFPPLLSLDRHPHNLAVQLTSFVGREAALAEVGGLLANHGLVTLIGSGGCGKTRLALQVAAEALGARADEAWFVDLSGLTDPALVPSAVMTAMGVQEVRDQAHTEALTSRLADRDALVVLDNCEHVLTAAAALAETLASRCGRLSLLATSREPLGVAGEVVWRVPSLSVPEEKGLVGTEPLDACEAARLFIERARAARPNFAITNENAPAVAAICQRLDGIPLAIELAAARARMMSVERVAEALADRFHLLSGPGRRSIPRQATLRASVDWSYDLLPEPERALLRRLSVFAGGLTLDAAEHVGAAGEMGRYDVLGVLSALVDKSLVQVNDKGDRYRLLETIRAYASEELAISGEEFAARDRHLTFFAELGEQAEKGMWTSATSWWLVVLGAEHDNLRAAVDWSLTTGQFDKGARLVYAISQFLYIRCFRAEGRRLCEEFLARDLAPARRADLYWWAAAFAVYSDPGACLSYGKALADLGRQMGDDRATARGLGRVGLVKAFSDPSAAFTTLGEAVAMARAVDDSVNVAGCLALISYVDTVLGRFDDALLCAEEALVTAQRDELLWRTAFASYHVAQAAVVLGELDRADAAAATVAELAAELDDPYLTMRAQLARGVVGTYRSQTWAAKALIAARELAESTHNDLDLGDVCYWQGALALALGHDEEGCAILKQAVRLVDEFRPLYGPQCRCLLAEAAVRRGDLAEARRWLDSARALPFPDQLFLATRAQARLARAKGDHRRAWELAERGLESARGSGARLLVVDFLELLALLAAGTERCPEAGRLMAAATTERDRLGYVRFCVDQPDVDVAMARIEAALGPSGVAAALSEGARLSVDDAAEYARRGRGERGRPRAGWAGLTPTELKVVELVVEGLTNAEIGQRMFVSVGTVKSHLNHIYDKLGVTNRRQLAGAASQVAT
jgi:predicted ATPase/class 3 adenylate cyclase/DNA-binding CsgD family transcriptional regulator